MGLASLPAGRAMAYYRALLNTSSPAAVAVDIAGSGHSDRKSRDPDLGNTMDSDSSQPEVLFHCDQGTWQGSDGESDPCEVILGDCPGRNADSQPAAGHSSRMFSSGTAGENLRPEGFCGHSQDGRAQALPSHGVFPLEVRKPVNASVKVETHLEPGQVGHYVRYVVTCPLARCRHRAVVPCGRRRNCGLRQFGHLGPAAPEAFLLVWAEAAGNFLDKEAHLNYTPTEAEVRRWMANAGWPIGSAVPNP